MCEQLRVAHRGGLQIDPDIHIHVHTERELDQDGRRSKRVLLSGL